MAAVTTLHGYYCPIMMLRRASLTPPWATHQQYERLLSASISHQCRGVHDGKPGLTAGGFPHTHAAVCRAGGHMLGISSEAGCCDLSRVALREMLLSRHGQMPDEDICCRYLGVKQLAQPFIDPMNAGQMLTWHG